MGTQLLQLKGGDIFRLINSMCRLVYLIYTIKSNFLTLIHTCSFHMNDVIKRIQQGIINCDYLDMYCPCYICHIYRICRSKEVGGGGGGDALKLSIVVAMQATSGGGGGGGCIY